jgi:ABC-type oligopeptide transport system ATPase subunit
MLVQTINIRKHFMAPQLLMRKKPQIIRAVDGVSLSVAEGQNLSLVGESGSGKTTLARMIIKLIDCDEGSIIYDGEDITSFKEGNLRNFRRGVQMVFQDPLSSLDPRFTIGAVLKEAMHDQPAAKKDLNEQEAILKAVLKSVRMPDDILSRYPHEFSGGERQRIAIARALIRRPKLLILDEAVSSLDVIIQEKIIQLLLDLQKEYSLTYLFISHNLRVVRKISHTIAVMYEGKIVEMASRDEIFSNPLHRYTQKLFNAAFKYEPDETMDNMESSPSEHLVEIRPGHWLRK